ncbi:hypothetical protein BOTBODRAFT_172076 [Botryobasidium botryosum FD-172 SS1]|uniref:DUF6532 domain-containing protein n=1 Tax=Botryobasidium botryosum (strain FD-172 SS1) TaxID=930990 RepID=A0A067N1F8_BOTB1|nr:hypothetical protein BOTBODRAFT_172076 [Botryobasidium botryosum FD-172 SS1]
MQAVLILAVGIFRSRIATEAPFPMPNQEKQLSEEAFISACPTYRKDSEPTEDQLKFICKGTCQMRGRLKDLAQVAVPLFYKLIQGVHHTHRNRLQYKKLIANDAYLYEDPDNLVGIWFAPLLFTIIQKMWFKREEDDGIKFSQYFHPEISMQTIALTFTAVQCALDEWNDSIHRPHAFKIYCPIYKTLLFILNVLNSNPEQEEVLHSLGTEFWESGSSL